MKHIIFLILLSIISLSGFGQTTNQGGSLIGKSFVTKTSIIVNPFNEKTNTKNSDITFKLNDGIKFFVYKVEDSGYVISVWDYNEKDVNGKLKNEFYSNLLQGKATKPETLINNNKLYYEMGKKEVNLPLDKEITEKKMLFTDSINLDILIHGRITWYFLSR